MEGSGVRALWEALREQALPHLAGPPVCPAVCSPPDLVPPLGKGQGHGLLELLGSERAMCSRVELAGQHHSTGKQMGSCSSWASGLSWASSTLTVLCSVGGLGGGPGKTDRLMDVER